MHQDEMSFWRRQNPARLHALFDAYTSFHRESSARPAQQPHKIKSLSAYLTGGE